MYKTTVTSEEKIEAVTAYLGGMGSQKSWSEKFGVHCSLRLHKKMDSVSEVQ